MSKITNYQGNELRVKCELMRYYLYTFRTAFIRNKKDLCCWGCGEKGTLCTVVGMQTGRATWKTVWRFFKKLKIEPVIWSSSPLLGKYPVEIKSGSQRAICTSMFNEILLTVAKIPKQLECPSMDEWIMKITVNTILLYTWKLQE